MNEQSDRDVQREKSRNGARNFGSIVYVGGTVAATVMFITFVLTAFPEDAYFSRIIMTMAALAVGSSMLAFPIALHNWVVTREHRFWGIILYYGEMLLIAVNTVVSFVTLLGLDIPWVKQYEPFSVASIIYTVFAWGTVFLLDPQHKEFADEQESDAKLNKKISNLTNTFLDTEDGQRLIQELAAAEVSNRWTVEKHMKRKGLARPEAAIPAPPVFQKKQYNTPQTRPVDEPVDEPVEEIYKPQGSFYKSFKEQDAWARSQTGYVDPALSMAKPGERSVLDVIDAGECTCPPAYFSYDQPSNEILNAVRERGGARCFDGGTRKIHTPANKKCANCSFFNQAGGR